MFSVVIPLYNKSAYILKAIDSVLNQSFNEFEIVLVDDGSTDDGREKINNYKKKLNLKINIIEQPNLGVSAARNNGVKVALFDYIAFLDADDWWHPDFLLTMKALIQNCPDAGIYGSQYYWVKNGGKRISQNGYIDGYNGYINYFKAYLYAWYMPLTSISTVLKKSVFNELNGFNPNLKFGEDFDLWVRIALKYKIAFVNNALAYYNQDVEPSNRALGYSKIQKKESHYIFNLEYLNQEEQQNHLLKQLLDGLRVRALLKYYLTGSYKTETQNILDKIDFSKQPNYYYRLYKYPLVLVKFYLLTKRLGSFFKQKFRKIAK